MAIPAWRSFLYGAFYSRRLLWRTWFCNVSNFPLTFSIHFWRIYHILYLKRSSQGVRELKIQFEHDFAPRRVCWKRTAPVKQSGDGTSDQNRIVESLPTDFFKSSFQTHACAVSWRAKKVAAKPDVHISSLWLFLLVCPYPYNDSFFWLFLLVLWGCNGQWNSLYKLNAGFWAHMPHFLR